MPTIGVSHGTWALPPSAASAGNVLVATSEAIYLYTMADDSWTDITPDPDPAGYPHYQFAASSGDHFWVVHGPFDLGMRHSADAGATWEHIDFPGDGDGNSINITLYNEVLYMPYENDSTAADGIYSRPMDGSGSWTLAYDGSPQTIFHMADINNSDRYWFGKSINDATRRFAYVDGGTETVISGITPPNPSGLGVATIPDNEPVAFGWSTFEFVSGGGTHAYKFNDNSYTDITPDAIETAAFGDGIYGLDAKDATTIVLVYYDSVGDMFHVYRSTDGGTTWAEAETYSSSNGGGVTIPVVVWSRLTPDLVVLALRSRIAYSGDGGQTWTESSSPPVPIITGLAVLS